MARVPDIASPRVTSAKTAYWLVVGIEGHTEREDLYVPDRFEALRDAGDDALRTIIVPVGEGLDLTDRRFKEMRASRRGALVLLRGDTGAGKSTFLDTVGLFRDGVDTKRVAAQANVGHELSALPSTAVPRLVVLEGREALGRGSTAAIEEALHAVNTFVRSDAGRDTLVVWPTNTDDLTDLLVEVGQRLGGEALFGVGDPVERFSGPPQEGFVRIAEQTVQALNEGASLAALGISDQQAKDMVNGTSTIGRYLAQVRDALIANDAYVQGLMEVERYRMWTLVIAGNDPENDVAAVTRSSQSYADIDRLMSSTGANVVKELKKSPEKLGILGTSVDARVLNMDMVTILSVAREFGDEKLHDLMRAAGMATSAASTMPADDRLRASELGRILANDTLGTRKRGSKAGPETKAAFESLAGIARSNDGAINRAIGAGLKQIGLIEDFEVEKDLGTDLKFTSDLFLIRAGEPVRIEVMWRTQTSRAGIANYVLGKLNNYGRAIGYLG
ncbi:MAG: hypothetical protein WKF96_19990 [Solirubrobacteraceae bacterium]